MIERILAATFVEFIRWSPEIASTNDLALQILSRDNVKLPLLVYAEKQTAGRGRAGNRWWSAEGALTFTLAVDAAATRMPNGPDPRISLAAALAVAGTLETVEPSASIALKWPNDVLLNGKKICGILVEIPPHSRTTAVIGIGLNLNNSLASAPAEIRESATSLIDTTGTQHDCSDVLMSLLQNLENQLHRLSSANEDLPERWEPYCALRGRLVRVQDSGREYAGECRGIDREGALLLREGTTMQRVVSGSVVAISE